MQWLWGFGDPHSSANVSSAQNPQHTFSGPGTYQVCLIVADANDRHAGTCATVLVPPAGSAAPAQASTSTASVQASKSAAPVQASKRTVVSTALSSPIS